MHKNQIWDPKWCKIVSQNGLTPLMFWCLLWHRLRSCLWGAPGHPKSCLNRKKTRLLRYLFSRTSAFVAADVLSSKKNSQRKSLQLFSPWPRPAEPWEGENAHTVSADCLGELFGGAAMTRRRRLRYKNQQQCFRVTRAIFPRAPEAHQHNLIEGSFLCEIRKAETISCGMLGLR